jgi:hypothetical protein
MTKKFLFFVFLFLCDFFSAHSQSNMEDVVYLKNGGVTRGIVLEIIPDKTIKIQTADQNIFVYNFDEVIKVVKETLPAQTTISTPIVEPARVQIETKPVSSDTTPIQMIIYKQEGFHNISKFGPLGLSGYSINIINGYQFNPYLLLGVGVGLDVHKGIGDVDLSFTNSATDYFLPVYLDFRYHVSKSRATFFMFMDMGYSVYLGGAGRTAPVVNSNYYSYSEYSIPNNGGTFFCPGIGGKVFLNKNIGVLVDFGFKFQTYGATTYTNSYNGYNSSGTSYTITESQSIKTSVSPVVNFGIAF